jgi:hypothetical protein
MEIPRRGPGLQQRPRRHRPRLRRTRRLNPTPSRCPAAPLSGCLADGSGPGSVDSLPAMTRSSLEGSRSCLLRIRRSSVATSSRSLVKVISRPRWRRADQQRPLVDLGGESMDSAAAPLPRVANRIDWAATPPRPINATAPTAPATAQPGSSGYCSGNGASTHQGDSSSSTRVTHLTQW